MLHPNPHLRFADPCVFATFAELFADLPKARPALAVAGRNPPRERPSVMAGLVPAASLRRPGLVEIRRVAPR